MFELPTIDPVTDTPPGGPPGLTLRPYAGEADVTATVEIMNRDYELDGVPERGTVEEVASRFRTPSDIIVPRHAGMNDAAHTTATTIAVEYRNGLGPIPPMSKARPRYVAPTKAARAPARTPYAAIFNPISSLAISLIKNG